MTTTRTPNFWTVKEAQAALEAGTETALSLAQSCLKEIAVRDSELNAFREVFTDVEDQARETDRRRAAGEKGPLLGIPFAIKDNILIEGRHCGASSKILENYIASYDATVIRKLKAAGVVFMGRTNMDEFAMGGSTENSAYGPTKNPFDTSRVAGGSSGGSAAAVAAGFALAALGTDTGGSVREPASFCGLVGVKPTYGTASRFGLIAMGTSLDQPGVFAHTAEDAQTILDTISGIDPLDSTTTPVNFYEKRSPKKRIGVPRALIGKGVDEDVVVRFNASLERMRTAGYEIVDIELPLADLALALYYIIMPAEVSTNLSRFDGVRYGLSKKGKNQWEDYALTRGEGFGPEVRRRIMLGTYVLSAGYYDAYYGKASAARVELRNQYVQVLKDVDAIAVPTAPHPAWVIGEKGDPLAAYLADIFTVSANLTGTPGISVPMGEVDRNGKQVPVGMLFTGGHGDEAGLFAVAKDFEKAQK